MVTESEEMATSIIICIKGWGSEINNIFSITFYFKFECGNSHKIVNTEPTANPCSPNHLQFLNLPPLVLYKQQIHTEAKQCRGLQTWLTLKHSINTDIVMSMTVSNSNVEAFRSRLSNMQLPLSKPKLHSVDEEMCVRQSESPVTHLTWHFNRRDSGGSSSKYNDLLP